MIRKARSAQGSEGTRGSVPGVLRPTRGGGFSATGVNGVNLHPDFYNIFALTLIII
jgi:hypothetical protein